jgi:exodeoxyribonuclease VII small subunit
MSKENKSIQDKLSELTKLVAWFDSDDFTLETAIDKFKEAENLAETIEKDLSVIKNDIQIVKQKFDSESTKS